LVEKNNRKVQEQYYFDSCRHGLYNSYPVLTSSFRKECIINNVTYSSGAEAARQLKKSPSAMYRFLKRRVTKVTEGIQVKISAEKKISINSQEFSSLKQAMSELGVAKSTLSRRLRSPKYPEWFYIQETRSNDYPERE
jgi:hypothetical protein